MASFPKREPGQAFFLRVGKVGFWDALKPLQNAGVFLRHPYEHLSIEKIEKLSSPNTLNTQSKHVWTVWTFNPPPPAKRSQVAD